MFRAACRARTAIAVFAIALLPALAQKAERGGPLEKPFIAPAEFVSIGQRVLTLFNRAGMHGGIAIVSEQCTEPTEQFPEFQGNIEGALQTLVRTGHELHWLQVNDGLIVYNTPGLPQLLTVTVREFRFSRKQALVTSSASLFNKPEVTETERSLHLVEYGPNLGFARPQERATIQDMVSLSDTTVMDALNRIADNHGVWFYRESRCQTNLVTLNWPIH
jgi:hypothetical protein